MRRTGVVVALLLLAALKTSELATADRVITGYDGRQIVFSESDDEILERALKSAEKEGYTFDMLTSSYTRMLTTLVNLGFTTDDVNRITPLVAARKGVRVSANPGRDAPDEVPWHIDFSEDLQRLRDALWSRGSTLRDFFDKVSEENSQDFGATEISEAFRIDTTATLAALRAEYFAAVASVEERLQKMAPGERAYVTALQQTVYDFQNPRWSQQCSVAQSKFGELWRQFALPMPEEGSALKRAMSQAVAEATARLRRFAVAAIVTGEDSTTLMGDDLYGDHVARAFKTVVVSGPVARPTQQVVQVTDSSNADDGAAPQPATLEYVDQDITASLCALYHGLRRLVLATKGGELDDAAFSHVRNLILHFKSSVQREVPDHFAPFFDADLVVVDPMLLRLVPVTIRFVYEELRREFASEGNRWLRSFPQFYRSVFEEATFLGHFFEQQFVRFLRRDAPDGSVAIVALPVEECRDKHFNNGTVATDECQTVFSQLQTHLVALQSDPVAVVHAEEVYPSDAPIVNLPLDTPTRAIVPDMFLRQWDVRETRLRVKYQVLVYQWAPARPPLERDLPPSFGEELDALIQAETDAASAAATATAPDSANGIVRDGSDEL